MSQTVRFLGARIRPSCWLIVTSTKHQDSIQRIQKIAAQLLPCYTSSNPSSDSIDLMFSNLSCS